MRMSGAILEICCDTLESALAAEAGGADRIEFCVDLPAGGVTPPQELFGAVKEAVEVPVSVLVRCRAGKFRLLGNRAGRDGRADFRTAPVGG